jgi:hypothetical protein
MFNAVLNLLQGAAPRQYLSLAIANLLMFAHEIKAASIKLKTGPGACVGPPAANFALISIRD